MSKSIPVEIVPAESSALAVVESVEALVARGHELCRAIRGFEYCKLQSQAMLGLVLSELRPHIIKPGARTDLTSPKKSERLTWPEFLKKTYDVTDDTARAYMAMGVAMKPRLKKLGGADMRLILDKPITSLTEAEYAALKTATHKITDGKTQMEFMFELGVAKGGPKKAHDHRTAAKAAQKKPTDDDREEAALDLLAIPLREVMGDWPKHWAHLPHSAMEEIDGYLLTMRNDLKSALQRKAA